VLSVAGRPFARALVAPTMSWLVPAAILFGGHGMTARDAVAVLRSSPAAWATIVLVFTALTSSAVAAALSAKGMVTLRALDPLRRLGAVGRVISMAPLIAIFSLAQSPLALLFARAGMWGAGALHAAFALALELLFVAVRTEARPLFARRTARARRPVAAMCAYYMRTLWRREHASLTLSAVAAALGAGALWLSFKNDPPRGALGRAMCVLPISLCAVAALLSRPLLREEVALRSVLRSTRTRMWVPAVSAIIVVCAPNAAYASAATYGATVAGAPGANVVTQSAGACVFGGLVALAVVLWGRRHAKTTKQDPALYVAGTIAIACIAIATGVMW
jgi:hypothetical protein